METRQHLNKYAAHSRASQQPGYLYPGIVACARKRRLSTITQAEGALARLQEREPGTVYHAYYCTFCHGYHCGRASGKGASDGGTG